MKFHKINYNMAVIYWEAGLVFRFFSDENNEFPHIHAYGQKVV
jgi:hypothetical protein